VVLPKDRELVADEFATTAGEHGHPVGQPRTVQIDALPVPAGWRPAVLTNFAEDGLAAARQCVTLTCGSGTPMSLAISHDLEARLAAKAAKEGLSIDAFLERLLNDAEQITAAAPAARPSQFPARYLGVRGSLHRRDIYEDVG
jgi:hypothetical protein